MRYYHYGADAAERPLRSNGMVRPPGRRETFRDDSDLVIEEDTIYEIDRECIGCKKRKMEAAQRF